MKLKGLLVLALTLATVPLLMASETKKSITLGEAAQVGTVTLQPGDYKVEWQGTGPNVQVNFLQGNKTVATAPATVANKNTTYDNAIQMKDEGNGAKAVTEIDWSHMALVFQPSGGNASPQPTSR